MNKLVKGSIAGAAGIALLLGGAGTLATWNSTADTYGAGTIDAGELTIVAHDFGSTPNSDGWTLDGGSTVKANPSDFTIVPGAKLTYTKTFDVTATGDNLTATVGLAPGSITSSTDANDVALAGDLTSSAAYTVGGTSYASTATPTITASAGTQTVVVSVTIKFDDNGIVSGIGAENDAMLGEVSLAAFAITLTQN